MTANVANNHKSGGQKVTSDRKIVKGQKSGKPCVVTREIS